MMVCVVTAALSNWIVLQDWAIFIPLENNLFEFGICCIKKTFTQMTAYHKKIILSIKTKCNSMSTHKHAFNTKYFIFERRKKNSIDNQLTMDILLSARFINVP